MLFGKFHVMGSSQGPRHRLREVLELHARSKARTFVEAYRLQNKVSAIGPKAAPMSVQSGPWMMAYLAANHMVCNRWFAPLPTDTQPNRLMGMGL